MADITTDEWIADARIGLRQIIAATDRVARALDGLEAGGRVTESGEADRRGPCTCPPFAAQHFHTCPRFRTIACTCGSTDHYHSDKCPLGPDDRYSKPSGGER